MSFKYFILGAQLKDNLRTYALNIIESIDTGEMSIN